MTDEPPPLEFTELELARLMEIRERIKYGYPDYAEWLAKLMTGWRFAG